MVKIFISHSSEDAAIAESLADLFHTALHLSKTEIRCTSVDGYRLPAGANTDEQLRREVLDSPVLVGLISHHSFESAYVLFELGARWGKNSFLAPVLAPGVPPSILRGPLSGLNALSCESASQIHQLVSDIASQLEIATEPAATYQGLIDAIIHIAPMKTDDGTKPPSVSAGKRIQVDSDLEDEYANAEEIIKRHCEAEWTDDYSMRAYCEEQQRRAVDNLQQQPRENIPSEVFQRIRAKAAKEWPEDFE
ncbi:MAG TPA: toll/interleukin-1 receptor domain-containing protein [Anaerolineales bacterium]|nr:toll/interleukin-1 receptor domain-containing protein [Anaerolineales bacterium]